MKIRRAAEVRTISRNMSHRDYDLFLASLFFLLITLLFFRDFIYSGKMPFDRLLDVLPPKYRAFSTLMSGQYPKWNPYIFLGFPFIGDNWSNPLDLFNLSFLFFEPVKAYVVSLMAVFFVGQVAFYLFARRELNLAPMPAAAGSVLFILNGFVMGFWVIRTHFAPIALTPLVFLFFLRAIDRRSYPYSIWCGVFCAISLFMGIISWSANLFFLFGSYAIYKGFGSWKRGEGLRKAAAPWAYFFAVLLSFVAVAAIELIPMAQLVANSQRRLITGGYSNILPFNYLGGLFFPARIELPAGLGWIINFPSAMYIGAAGIALALLGLIKFRRSGSPFYFGLIAIPSAVFFILFRIDGVASFWQKIPFLGGQQLTRLMATVYPLSSAVLVAFGLQYLWDKASGAGEASAPSLPRRLSRVMLALNLAAGAIFSVLFAASPLLKPLFMANIGPILEKFFSPGSAANPYPTAYYMAKATDMFSVITSGAVFSAIAVAVLIRVASLISLGAAMRNGGKFCFYILSATLLSDVFLANSYSFYEAKINVYRNSSAIAFLKERMSPGDRAVMWNTINFPDAASTTYDYEKMKAQRLKFVEDYAHNALAPNILMFFGVPELGGTNSLYHWRYLEYIDNIDKKVDWRHGERSRLRNLMSFQNDPDEKLLNMVGMRYIFSQRPISSPKLKLLVGRDQNERGLYLYENIGALPRAYVVAGERILGRDAEVLKRLKSDGFDPRRQALIHRDGAAPEDEKAAAVEITSLHQETQISVGRARILDYTPNRVKINAFGFDGSYLVLSDNYFPGWKAKVDGAQADVLRANYLMRAVSLGPGDHQVEFYFDPLTFKVGATITIVALLIIAARSFFMAIRRNGESAI